MIKEDLVRPDLLFLGTGFGLSISIDGGKNWAAFKGTHFPAVAVRDRRSNRATTISSSPRMAGESGSSMVRKLIVATTEGGAITGEERLREHTAQPYGAILSYEGKPAAYQIDNLGALKRELADVTGQFAGLLGHDLPTLNDALKAGGEPGIESPPAKVAVEDDDDSVGNGGNLTGQPADRDEPAAKAILPSDFRPLHQPRPVLQPG